MANIVLQFFLLNHFLDAKHYEHLKIGITVLRNLLREIEWDTSGIFPRVTLCDFEVCTCVDAFVRSYMYSGARSGQHSSAHSTMCAHDQHVQREDLPFPLVLVLRCRRRYHIQRRLLAIHDVYA